MTRLFRYFSRFSIALLGIAVVVGIMAAIRLPAIKTAWQKVLYSVSEKENQCELAQACQPQSEEEEIFFISCGGIF